MKYLITILFLLSIHIGFTMPPPTTFVSDGNGDWESSSTWDVETALGCSINNTDVIIDNPDSVWSSCDPLEIKGTATIIIRSGAILYITGNGGLTGAGTIIIEPGGTLIVDGNFSISGTGSLTLNGDMQVGGDFSVSGSGTTDGGGTLIIDGEGCDSWGGDGDCIDSNISLPIELLEFFSYLDSNKIILNWITASETNNDYFTIERSSDGKDFIPIIKTYGAGNSQSLIEYSEIDYYPILGKNYYRLKQTDFDGRFSYSNIVSVNYNIKNFSDSIIKIYPNPVNIDTDITITNIQEETLIVIMDTFGRIFFSKFLINNVENNIVFTISNNIPSGTYMIIGSSNNKYFNSRIVIN
jgi:hypothetical protein